MGYLPNLLSSSSQDLFGIVLEAQVKQKTGAGSGLRYFVYLTVELQQHPNKKRIYSCVYVGTLRFSLTGDRGLKEYISHGDSHAAIQKALEDGFTLGAIATAIKVVLEGRPVSANQSGGLWFAH